MGAVVAAASLLLGTSAAVAGDPLWGCADGYELQVEEADGTPQGVRCYRKEQWYYDGNPDCHAATIFVDGVRLALNYMIDRDGVRDLCTGGNETMSVSILPKCAQYFERLEQDGPDACRKLSEASFIAPTVPVPQ